MDEVDFRICLMLQENSRTSYRALAEKLDLSINAVHKRIQDLIGVGVIKKFPALPSMLLTGHTVALIHGISTKNIVKQMDELGSLDPVYWVAAAGGNYMYVGVHIKSLNELPEVVQKVEGIGGMQSLAISIIASMDGAEALRIRSKLDQADWKIIKALSDDSRKPVSEIAEELGMTARTVTRRLDEMISEYLIELTIEMYPDVSDDILTIFHLKLMHGSKLNMGELTKKYYPHVVYVWAPVNQPNEFIVIGWNQTTKSLKELRGKLEEEPGVDYVTPNILFTGKIYPSWRNRFCEEMIAATS